MKIEATIDRFIVEEIMLGDGPTKIDPDQSLIDDGILDSLALQQLIHFIETQFSLTIEDGELIPDNFQTINALKSFIESKLKGN